MGDWDLEIYDISDLRLPAAIPKKKNPSEKWRILPGDLKIVMADKVTVVATTAEMVEPLNRQLFSSGKNIYLLLPSLAHVAHHTTKPVPLVLMEGLITNTTISKGILEVLNL